MARERGGEEWVVVDMGSVNKDICNSVNNKKKKNIYSIHREMAI